jgi:outer membrane protein OmpA-like peptidoglycan-associated protein
MQVVAIFLIFVVSSFASMNKHGMHGVHKTQSAKTMGHSRMGMGLMADINNNAKVFQDGIIYKEQNLAAMGVPFNPADSEVGVISNLLSANMYLFMSVGLGNYVDLSLVAPVYYENISVDSKHIDESKRTPFTGLEKSGLGDIRGNMKVRFPLPEEDNIFDMALLLGGQYGTSNTLKGGLYPREIDYIRQDSNIIYSYGTGAMSMSGGLAVTLDFAKLTNPFPLEIHSNYVYRTPLVNNFTAVSSFSIAAELTPVDFFSLYGEFYNEFPEKFPKDASGTSQEVSLSQMNFGVALHTVLGMEFYVGLSMGFSPDSYMDSIYGGYHEGMNPANIYRTNARTVSPLSGHLGITWNGYLIPRDQDDDGIWDKYDKCPMEPGPERNDGCPWANPDLDDDGICDVWVAEKGLQDEFDCAGIDQCPNQAGPAISNGCPTKNPDIDEDGVCDAWVTQENMLEEFAEVCSGVDKCPNEPGPPEEGGCPAANPDIDSDGVCDSWVAEKGLFEKYASVCSGIDKCPNDKGESWNNGCPAEDPDLDKDGVCAPWVAEQGLADKFASVCKGIDKCPNDPGTADNGGCPEAAPDIDEDGVCDPWVAEKGLLAKYKETCKGIDQCPNRAGTLENDGCPAKPIEKKVTLKGVNFKSGTSELTFESKNILDPVVEQLLAFEDVTIEIWGHTDDRGSAALNKTLSMERAQAVVDYFRSKGIASDRMKAIGHGPDMPVASNKSADGRAQNRRIEMYRVK